MIRGKAGKESLMETQRNGRTRRHSVMQSETLRKALMEETPGAEATDLPLIANLGCVWEQVITAL